MRIRIIILLAILLASGRIKPAMGQDLDLLDDMPAEEITNYTTATFKANRVINGHSIEMVKKNEFDFKISHRFGFVNTGAYELFGLDQATMRIGGDYGITDRINVGLGRSNEAKTYDGFVKFKLLRQSNGEKVMPVSVVAISHMGISTLKWTVPDRENFFSSRMHYTHQILLARKFNESFSLQLVPTMVHKNLIDSSHYSNDILSIGFAMRQKLTQRVSVNLEYYYLIPGALPADRVAPLSLGFDIETGGHVFQLFFTNAHAAYEKAFLTDTRGKWSDGDIRFGFNVSRMFSF